VGTLSGLTHVWPTRFTTHRTGRDLARDFVWQVQAMRDNSLWLATNAPGVVRLSDGVLTPVATRPPLPDRQVLAIGESRDGSTWLAFRGGGIGQVRDGKFQYEGLLPGAAPVEVRTILDARKREL